MKPYTKKNSVIIINRDLTLLDKFVKDFLSILKTHSDYLIVSGYVSIATGRSRGTEDVDIIFPKPDIQTFSDLFSDLQNKYWCFQGDNLNEIYPYIESKQNIRFALKEQIFPNIELIPFDKKDHAKYCEFNNPQKMKIKDFEFKIPPLEFEILYKELKLGGRKDIQDAQHLRTLFSDILKQESFAKYKKVLK